MTSVSPGAPQDRDVLAPGVQHHLDVRVGQHLGQRRVDAASKSSAERVDHLGAHASGRRDRARPPGPGRAAPGSGARTRTRCRSQAGARTRPGRQGRRSQRESTAPADLRGGRAGLPPYSRTCGVPPSASSWCTLAGLWADETRDGVAAPSPPRRRAPPRRPRSCSVARSGAGRSAPCAWVARARAREGARGRLRPRRRARRARGRRAAAPRAARRAARRSGWWRT